MPSPAANHPIQQSQSKPFLRLIPLDDTVAQPGATVFLLGKSYFDVEPKPLTFKEMRDRKTGENYLNATPFISFRVVLEQ